MTPLKDAVDLYLHGGVTRHVVADPQPERLGLARGQLVDRTAGSAHDRAVRAVERHAENGTQFGVAVIYRFPEDLVPATAALLHHDVGEGDVLSGPVGHS